MVIIVVVGSLLFFGYGVFNVKSFEISTEKDCVKEEKLREDLISIKPNLLVSTAKSINVSLKNKYSCVDNVVVEKVYPSTLKVAVFSNLPIAKFENSNLLVDGNGQIVEGTASGKVPTIYPQSALEKSALGADGTVSFASGIIKSLKDSDFLVSNVRILDDENIVVYNSENAIAVFSSKVDLQRQIRSLQSVIAKSKIDAAKISKIDLRYTMPVVVFK